MTLLYTMYRVHSMHFKYEGVNKVVKKMDEER